MLIGIVEVSWFSTTTSGTNGATGIVAVKTR